MSITQENPTLLSPLSGSPIIHDCVQDWVNALVELMQPDSIHWCDGSAQEAAHLTRVLVEQGTLHQLNPDLRPNSYVARSEPSDVARVEARTYICSREEADAGPTNNWEDPELMREKLRELARGSMAGRTLYVVPFSLGPLGSPLARMGVQVTDSAYVALNLHIMVRVTEEVWGRIDSGANLSLIHI